MNNRDYISSIITQFSGQNNIIPIPTIYIRITEDYPTAALLNQLIYWSDRTHRKDGYFYKSYKEWEDEIYLSKYQVMRSIKIEKYGDCRNCFKRRMVRLQSIIKSIVKLLHNGLLSFLTMESQHT